LRSSIFLFSRSALPFASRNLHSGQHNSDKPNNTMDDTQHSEMETLGDRMKAYEREFESHLSRDKPFIIRLA
jgi:hypothetical protein